MFFSRIAGRPFTLLRAALATSLVAGALAACGGGGGGGPAPVPTAPPTVNAVVPPAGSIYLGAFSNPDRVTPPPVAALATLESEVGRTMALTQHYFGFYDNFPGAYEADDAAHGRIPIDSWNCAVPDAAIAAGNQDTYLRKRADALKAYGRPIFLRFMWEVNLPADQTLRTACYDPATDGPNETFAPAPFIAAWIHMRNIFLSEGATNVIWLWNPSASNVPLSYYPGGANVDWVGIDDYDATGLSFGSTFAQAYLWLAPLNKPIMIGETGAPAAVQPAFFGSAAATLQALFPQIKGLVYFNSSTVSNSWVLSPSGLAAFGAMAKAPYFAARYPSP